MKAKQAAYIKTNSLEFCSFIMRFLITSLLCVYNELHLVIVLNLVKRGVLWHV